MAQPPRTALIIDTSPFGSSLSLLPAVRTMRERFRNAFVVAAASGGTCQLLASAGLVNEVFSFGVIKPSSRGSGRSVVSLLRLIGKTRSNEFDLIVDFNPHFSTQILGWMSHSRVLAPIVRLSDLIDPLLG
ncbi:MAG TPA: hypothetical protein VJX67_19450, partial [Blastocatellia bacterium]|nr:hypothetical protein [Blastocatellia bacterium]